MAFKVRAVEDPTAPKKFHKVKIKKDETGAEKAIAGRDKAKRGTGAACRSCHNCRVLVEGVSMVKRHTRPTRWIKGEIVERENSIAISNVLIVTSGGVATRVGYRTETTGM